MWRRLSKEAVLRKLKFSSECHMVLPSCANTKLVHDQFLNGARCFVSVNYLNSHGTKLGFYRDSYFREKSERGSREFSAFSNFNRFCEAFRGYATAAEALVSTSEEDTDEIQEEIEDMNTRNNSVNLSSQQQNQQKKPPKMVEGMGKGKYHILRKRQMKVETEAWEEAAKEYQELLEDMCQHKLAPNLPYMKSLFLGWFEPMRDAIASEQDLCEKGMNRTAYAPYFNILPADMMAVITMHKLMGVLMTGGGHGNAKLVQAAIHIGEAIEHEVSHFGILSLLKFIFTVIFFVL